MINIILDPDPSQGLGEIGSILLVHEQTLTP